GVTSKIVTLGLQDIPTINSDIQFEIDVFEKEQKIKFADSQREAILGAFNNGIEIITGGPGTGKTTIIKAIIHFLQLFSELQPYHKYFFLLTPWLSINFFHTLQ
ncbi:Helicase, RecD/TraA family, partial [human gut metagenome]